MDEFLERLRADLETALDALGPSADDEVREAIEAAARKIDARAEDSEEGPETSLAEPLRDLVASHAEEAGWDWSWEASAEADGLALRDRELLEEVADAALRAVRHRADVETVSVDLEVESETVELTVGDDGRPPEGTVGSPVEQTRRVVEERGGSIRVTSSWTGSEVVAQFPCT